ncbi:hypothetical protein MSU_0047 [Mycoplasma suis str. Illinois]|uniref:Uncharacterized protein n=1 Tax=Mycoplasma suis (strain Illinois) TaxID=768700 RepID=F0QQ21_MYCSL|nr:hypothetical protein MSU_0047 [Mycoplasma suis str. Illinois]
MLVPELLLGTVLATSNNKVEVSENNDLKHQETAKEDVFFSPPSSGEEIEIIIKVPPKGEEASLDVENKREIGEILPKKDSETPKQSLEKQVISPKENTLPKKSEIQVEKNSRRPRRIREHREELTGEKKWEKEIGDYQISLESIYKYGVGDGSLSEKGCIFYKETEEVDEDSGLDITEGRSREHSYDPCEWQTNWSSSRAEGEDKTGLWVRGKTNLVNKLLRKNWNDLFVAGFAKNKDISVETEDSISELKDSCKVVKKEDNSWVEISCIPKN